MQAKSTTALPLAQHHLQKPLCLYEQDLECIVSPIFLRVLVLRGVYVLFRSDALFEKALAVELLEMLVPLFPNSQFRITQTGGITREPDEFATLVDAHKNRIIQCREEARPGLAYLQSVGVALDLLAATEVVL